MALLKVSKKASIDTIYACLKSFLASTESGNMDDFCAWEQKYGSFRYTTTEIMLFKNPVKL